MGTTCAECWRNTTGTELRFSNEKKKIGRTSAPVWLWLFHSLTQCISLFVRLHGKLSFHAFNQWPSLKLTDCRSLLLTTTHDSQRPNCSSLSTVSLTHCTEMHDTASYTLLVVFPSLKDAPTKLKKPLKPLEMTICFQHSLPSFPHH